MARRKRSSARGKGSSVDLSGVSTQALKAELDRRSAAVGELAAKRDEIDLQIRALMSELGGGGKGSNKSRKAPAAKRGKRTAAEPASGRKRFQNEMNLVDSLRGLLKGKSMGVSEITDAVQKAGYQTTSPNFRTIVNQTLIKSGKFKKVARGQYTAA